MAPTDDRLPVAVVQILHRPQLLPEQGHRVIVGALAALLQDHLALSGNILLAEAEIGHPVAFHLHHQLQPVGCDALEIGRVVVAGEGVVLAAIGAHSCRQLSPEPACQCP